LAASNSVGDVAQVGHIVTVGGLPPADDKPDEPDTPDQPDEPDEPDPPANFGLAPLVKAWLKPIPPSENNTRSAIKKTLNDIAALAEGGRFVSIVEMNTASAAALKGVINNPLPWAAFGIGFTGELAKLTKNGTIKTVDQYAKAFREIAGAM
jgi:hypothetical protein